MYNNTPTKSFKHRIIQASIWAFGGHFFSQLIRLGSNLVMTRLLAPEMFGLMSIAILISVGIALFTDIGLGPNVIQSKKSSDPEFMDAIWTIQILKGLFIWGLMIFFSLVIYVLIHSNWVPINTVYANPLVPILVPIISLSVVISGLEPTWTMLATKEMNQSLVTKIEIGSQIISVFVMIIWAYFNRSIWALVAGALSASLAKCLLTYQFNQGRLNRWNLDYVVVKEVFVFGKWILVTTLVGFYAINGDRILLGGLVNEHKLGLYSIACMILGAIWAVYSKLLANVVYPAFCEANHQGDEKLKQTYFKFQYLADCGLYLPAGILFVAAGGMIDFLYDSRYHETGQILQVISITLISLRYFVAEQVFVALGKPYMSTYCVIARTAGLFILVPIVFHQYGFNGALWAIVAANFVSFPLVLFYKKRLNMLSFHKELITVPVFFVGLAIGGLILKVLGS